MSRRGWGVNEKRDATAQVGFRCMTREREKEFLIGRLNLSSFVLTGTSRGLFW